MKNQFLQICMGVSLVVFSVGFLIRSIEPAKASSTNNFPMEGSTKIGKYQVNLSSCVDAEAVYDRIIIMDTETAKSVIYKGKNGNNFEKAPGQLPEKPIE